jgi:phosphate uptake regulator
MPVTARLSKRFYEQLGDDVANELVEWFNAVDATYRLDLRDLNELNFARFDAKVEQRFAQQWAQIEARFAQQDVKWEQRFAELTSDVERRFGELTNEVERRFAELEPRFAQLDAKIDQTVAAAESRILRWMVGLWLTSALGIASLAVALLGRR